MILKKNHLYIDKTRETRCQTKRNKDNIIVLLHLLAFLLQLKKDKIVSEKRRIGLQPTEFKDVRTGEISYGFRIFDDYETAYCNLFNNIPDDDMEFLNLVFQNESDDNYSLITAIISGKADITIGNKTYTYDDYKHISNGYK